MKQTPFYYTLRRLLALSVMSLLTLATLSLTSCRHKDTEHDDYGLSAALSWADPADAGREIKNVRIWIFQAGGKLVAKRQYGSKFLIALDIHPLPLGSTTWWLRPTLSSLSGRRVTRPFPPCCSNFGRLPPLPSTPTMPWGTSAYRGIGIAVSVSACAASSRSLR